MGRNLHFPPPPPDAAPPALGEPGTIWFFHCHPVAGACRVEWRGFSPDGEMRLDAPDLGVGFAVGPSMWPHASSPRDLAYRRRGALFVAACRAFRLAISPDLGAAALRYSGLRVPRQVRDACYGRLARAAAERTDGAAAVSSVDAWVGSADFDDDVRLFGPVR